MLAAMWFWGLEDWFVFWQHLVLVAACRILSGGMWDL